MQSKTNYLVLEKYIFESWIAWGIVGMRWWMQNVEAEKNPAFLKDGWQ